MKVKIDPRHASACSLAHFPSPRGFFFSSPKCFTKPLTRRTGWRITCPGIIDKVTALEAKSWRGPLLPGTARSRTFKRWISNGCSRRVADWFWDEGERRKRETVKRDLAPLGVDPFYNEDRWQPGLGPESSEMPRVGRKSSAGIRSGH